MILSLSVAHSFVPKFVRSFARAFVSVGSFACAFVSVRSFVRAFVFVGSFFFCVHVCSLVCSCVRYHSFVYFWSVGSAFSYILIQ